MSSRSSPAAPPHRAGSNSHPPSGSSHREASASSVLAVAPSGASSPPKRDTVHRTDHVLPGPVTPSAPYMRWRTRLVAREIVGHTPLSPLRRLIEVANG